MHDRGDDLVLEPPPHDRTARASDNDVEGGGAASQIQVDRVPRSVLDAERHLYRLTCANATGQHELETKRVRPWLRHNARE